MCLHAFRRMANRKEGEVFFGVLTLFKWDSGTSGTSRQKASFEEISVQASLALSSSLSLGSQSPSVCHYYAERCDVLSAFNFRQ